MLQTGFVMFFRLKLATCLSLLLLGGTIVPALAHDQAPLAAGMTLAAPSLTDLIEQGIHLAGRGDLESAKQTFEQALALKPEEPSALNGLGYVYYRQERLEPAIACYKRALSHREDPQYRLNLGLAYLGQKRWGQAEDEFRRAAVGNPKDYWAANNLGYALQLQARVQEAVAAYEGAIALATDDLTAHGNLGSLLVEQRAWSEAAWVYRDALKHDDALGEAHIGLANALTQMGKLDMAVVELRVGLGLTPDSPQGHHLMAELYRHQNEWGAAEREARQAIRLNPKDPAFRLCLADTLVSAKRPLEARVAYLAFLKLAPAAPEAERVRTWLTQAPN